jgi:hypothetical protein|tara:strand:- start:20369 stop:21658 length:1290 start_codon:yes stop_codon:yes gene_type:complete
MASVNNVKVTIGGPESVPGTAEAREAVIPHRGLPNLRAVIENAPDPAITGENMILDKYALAGDVNAPVDISPRASAGIGMLFNAALGQEGAPTQIAAAIRVRYTGSDASAKLTANTSADTFDSDTGVKGAEVADTNWGTAGSIDLTAVGTDTVGEVVTEIDGYADYECEKVFGADATDAGDIEDITNFQAKDGWVTIWFTSASSGVYRHLWEVVLANTERPVYTIQVDGRQNDYLYDGCAIDRLTLSSALKAFLEGSVQILGMEETAAGSPSTLEIEDVEAMVFSDSKFSIAANDYTFLRSISVEIANNHNPDGYGTGSIYRQYHEKGILSVSGTMQIRLDATSILEKAKVTAGTMVNIYNIYEAGAFDANINETIGVQMPYCLLDDFEWTENGPVIDARIPYTAVKGKNSPYNHPLTVWMLTSDSGAY